MEERKESRASLFGPLFLIFIGIVFLLNNMGVLSWDIWLQLLRLWPVLLIGAGLDVLFGRRSLLSSLSVSVVMIGLLATGLWFLTTQTPTQPVRTEEIVYALDDIDMAKIDISFGVGTLHIDSQTDTDMLIEGTADLSTGEKLVEEYSSKGSKATLKLESDNLPVNIPNDWNKDKTWAFTLNEDIDIDLDIDTGVGVAELDLRRLRLNKLNINSGVGKNTIILPQTGQAEVTVDGGVGQLVIQIPEGMEVEIRADAGLGSISVPKAFTRDGNTYTSPGYEREKENRITLDIDGGVGHVIIEMLE